MENPNGDNSQVNTNAEIKPAISNESISKIEVKDAEEVIVKKEVIVSETKQIEVPKDNNYHKCTIQCCIRRKPDMMSLPGQDPAEKVYRIGSALDRKTNRDLKGISGDLEKLYMPAIVGVSYNDPSFGNAISEYWASIAKVVPPDEPFLKDYEKGVKINITVTVLGSARKERFDKLLTVVDKIDWLGENLIKNNLVVVGDKTEERPFARLDYDSVSDFLFISYCLKYPKVANNLSDVNNSPKIEFYIFEKELAVKTQLSFIDLRKKATALYESLESDENRINAVLLGFDKNPKDFENITDKLIEIDEHIFNKGKDSMKKFVSLANDDNWKIKYLINSAITAQKLRKPANSSAIYYNDTLLGMTIEEAALFLTSDTKGKEIHEGLVKEINLK